MKKNLNKESILVIIKDKEISVSPKWYRGASRYNNGATKFGRKYFIRLIMSWAKNKSSFK
jgi:hypothetical protein